MKRGSRGGVEGEKGEEGEVRGRVGRLRDPREIDVTMSLHLQQHPVSEPSPDLLLLRHDEVARLSPGPEEDDDDAGRRRPAAWRSWQSAGGDTTGLTTTTTFDRMKRSQSVTGMVYDKVRIFGRKREGERERESVCVFV